MKKQQKVQQKYGKVIKKLNKNEKQIKRKKMQNHGKNKNMENIKKT